MQPWLWPWIFRALWVSLPFLAGPLIGDALADTARAVQLTGTIGVWIAWAAVLILSLIPHTVTLTPVRIVAPASFAIAVWATIDAGVSGTAVVALAATAVASAVVFSPHIGTWFINGSSYGDERRLPLRAPAPMLLAPIPIAWVIVVATSTVAPLAIAAQRWFVAVPVVVLGAPLAYQAVKSLHALARRWLVFVPAGIVVHDLLAMADPVLIKRSAITRFGPALEGSTGTDLTGGASGLALEVQLHTPATVALRLNPTAEATAVELETFYFTPTLPGAVLDEAERRNIAIG